MSFVCVAAVRREEVLEVRAEGSRLERELKAAQAAKKERIREHELHLAIEETEVSPVKLRLYHWRSILSCNSTGVVCPAAQEKHRRLDLGIQAKQEFKVAQAGK